MMLCSTASTASSVGARVATKTGPASLAVYRLELNESAEGVAVFKALWSTDVAKNASEELLAREAAILDRLLRQLLLGETAPPAPAREDEPAPGRHLDAQPRVAPSAATDPAPVAPAADRPWWRFWG